MNVFIAIGLSLLMLFLVIFAVRFLHDKILDNLYFLDDYRSITQGVALLFSLYLWAFPFNLGFYSFFS